MANSKNSPLHVYPGTAMQVQWDRRLCIHVGECARAEGELFVAGRTPWCRPDVTDVDEVHEVVGRCPTGALSVLRLDGEPEPVEATHEHNTVAIANNGPLYLRGQLEIEGAAGDMPGVRLRAALCRCGQSANKPFCDNTHEKAGFTDRGAVGESGLGGDGERGALRVRPVPNGPLLLTGNFSMLTPSGRTAFRGTKAALCRCGESKNKPFCDGSHQAAGFSAE